MIKPLKQRNISDRVYEQLRDMIYRGELAHGERLMAERELAQLFHVGRPTVRSAIQRLVDQGIVFSRRGVGTFVQPVDGAFDKKPLLQVLNAEEFTITDIHESRLALEARSAELAARRATDQDVRKIKKVLERLREESKTQQIDIKTDIVFHMNITYASKNIVQIHLMKSFYDVQLYAMSQAYTKILESAGIDKTVDKQHEAIFTAIENRDPVGAKWAMEDHISTILEVCIEHGL